MSDWAWANDDFAMPTDPNQALHPGLDQGTQGHMMGFAPYGQQAVHNFGLTALDQGPPSCDFGGMTQYGPGWNVAFTDPFPSGPLDAAALGAASTGATPSTRQPSPKDTSKDYDYDSKADSPVDNGAEPPTPAAHRASVIDDQGPGRPLVARAGCPGLHKRKRSSDSDAKDESADETDMQQVQSLGPMSMSRSIPPRPKPGRKPASDQPVEKRKAQNREAQRQFRHRKNEQADDLKRSLEDAKADNRRLTADLHREALEHGMCKKALTRFQEKAREEKQKADETILELSQRLSNLLHTMEHRQPGVPDGFQQYQPVMEGAQQMLAFAQEYTQDTDNMADQGQSLDLSILGALTPAEIEAILANVGSMESGGMS